MPRARSKRLGIDSIRRVALFIVAALALTQCVPSREVQVAYQTPMRTAMDADPKLKPVTVMVVDKRPTTVVGHPLGFFGEREGNITSEEQASEALKKAFDIELRNKGFSLGTGGSDVVLTMTHFESQYVHPLFHTRAVASIGVEVKVRNAKGSTVYSGYIVGQADQPAEAHFEGDQSIATNVLSAEVSDVLNAAMEDAVTKTLNDPAFMGALGWAPAPAPTATPGSAI
jgi:uncharacterized lipoprotein YajG